MGTYQLCRNKKTINSLQADPGENEYGEAWPNKRCTIKE